MLIAPANYGAQGYRWARAAETLEGVSAANLCFKSDDAKVVAPADFSVRKNVGKSSHLWARRQRKSIQENVTHMLVEAELPVLGALYGADLVEEVRDLQASGVKVAAVSHGTDVRLPSLHAALEPRSPYLSDPELAARLEKAAAHNHATLDALQVPEFVSTPDLLEFRPNATWLPVVVDPAGWEGIPPTNLSREKLRVMHFPGSQPVFKGSKAIRAAMRRLETEGLIDYVEPKSVPFEKMADIIGDADVVINQVDMGLYAAVGVEAMLAGRLVVSQVWDSVRQHVEQATGRKVPIVEADAETLYQVVKDICLNRDSYRHLPQEGRDFAKAVHSPEHAAAVLQEFLSS